jgi:predicted  nucleic acid-binding Zn-ribbon protein
MEVVSDYSTLKAQNDREESSLDTLFTQKQDKENQLQRLEAEIERERSTADNLVNEMGPEQQQHYSELKDINEKLQQVNLLVLSNKCSMTLLLLTFN